MTFALVAFLLIGPEAHAFVLDEGLSYADCTAAVSHGVTLADDNHGGRVDLASAALVCELEA